MRLLFSTLLFSLFLSAGGVLDVDWSSVNQSQQKTTTPYPEILTKEIKEITLPVYLSSSYAYNKNMTVVADKYFYSISFDLDGLTLLFEGDRTFQEVVSVSNTEFQKIVKESVPVEFSKSEEVMIAEFNRHGANYAISVECVKPKTDERCVEENFIRDLYKNIVMVGGRP